MQIVLISGFLGSGKTTFLQHLAQELHTQKSYKIALVINEFADISIDLPSFPPSFTTLSITHGSIFCTCKTDEFFACIKQLTSQGFDYALVEASGFANLKGLQAVGDALSNQLEVVWLDRIVLVDAARILKWLKVAVNAKNQIEMATILIINKIDLVSEEQVEEVRSKITALNPHAKIFCTSYGHVDIASCLHALPISNEKPLWITKNLREAFLTLQIERNVSLAQLETALAQLSEKIFRAKGFIATDDKTFYVDFSGRFTATPCHQREEVGKLVLLYDIALVTQKEILEIFHTMILK